MPSEAYLSGLAEPVEVDLIFQARNAVKKIIAQKCYDQWLAIYKQCLSTEPYAYNANEVARRSLKNTALAYLMLQPTAEVLALCQQQLITADNMTDEAASLSALVSRISTDSLLCTAH